MKNIPEMRFKGFTDAWEQRKLGEFCDMFNGDRGINYPSDSDMVSEGIPFVNAGDLQNGHVNLASANKITREKFDQLGGAKIQYGDILYCLRGTLGKNAFVDNFGEGTVASSLVDIRPKNINPQYLFTVLNSDIEYRQRTLCDEGAAQPNLSAKNLANFDIPVPEYKEQVAIGKFFEKITHLITLHQRKYEKMLDVKNAMLVMMFPRPGEDKPDMRFKGYESAWQTVRLGDIVERVTRKNSNLESTLPLTISAQYGLIDQNEFFNKQVASKDVSNYYLIRNGEFAYNKSTSSDAPFGAVKRLDRYDCGVLSTLYIMFRIKEDSKVDSDYLVQYYNTNLWHEGIQKIAAEGARNHGLLNIVPDDFFNTTLMIPQDISEQRKIGQYFRSLDNLIEIKKNKVEKLQDVKKALLQAMFV